MKEGTPRHPDPIRRAMRRVDKRVDRVLKNPELTDEQKQEIFTLATLAKAALSLRSPIALEFGKQLIDLTEPLMPPEKPAEEGK